MGQPSRRPTQAISSGFVAQPELLVSALADTRKRSHRTPPFRTAQRLHSGTWCSVSRMPRPAARVRSAASQVASQAATPAASQAAAQPSALRALRTALHQTARPRPGSESQAMPPRTTELPFPHLPAGLAYEPENSIRSLATMVVAFHETLSCDDQAEFVRQVMKFAGEQAGLMIRRKMEPPRP
ncbi:MAG: hypothetical protein ACKO6N_15375 [Myxococcota bacterium]